MKNITIGNTTIKDVEILPDVNFQGEYDLRINTNEDVIWPTKECIDESYDGSLYYGENNGVVNYGFIKANDKTRYMWSSRAGVINCHVPTFKHCKESAINGFAADLTIDKINEILHEYYPGQYSVKRDINHPKEIRYIIVKR